jgi:DNA-binding IclR family transcriptional regulator
VLTVLSESSPHLIQAAGWVGRTVPAYGASAGQALLLDHTRDELRALFGTKPLPQLGPRTPRTADELYERIETARTRGYALVDEEFEPGLVAAAAPVRDFRGRIVGALNMSAPKFRVGDRLEEAGEVVSEGAGRLSSVLGWVPDSPLVQRG